MTTIPLVFAGAPDATAGSTYKIERTVDNVAWTTLAAAQPAAAPYVSPTTISAAPVTYKATTLDLVNAANIPSSGSGYLDGEALVSWTGKAGDQLTGVTWKSGDGTYTAGSAFVVAHESYTDANATLTLGAALYRITHINADALQSAPAYVWYFNPPTPASARHCVVIIALATDLGLEHRATIAVTAQLATNDQLINASGETLKQGSASTKAQSTNAFGLAFFQCWKSAGRITKGGSAPKGYTFSLDGLTVTASTIPDQDWCLLEDIADA